MSQSAPETVFQACGSKKSKKKSKTEDLVKEANELAEKNKSDKVIENVVLEQEEEREFDR